MATQVVELTGDEAALLRSYDRAVKKAAELEAKMRTGGDVGAAAGVQIEDALNKVKKANDEALRGMLKDLKAMGPAGSAAADNLKGHFAEVGKAGFKSMSVILDELRAIDPVAAEVAEKAANAFQQGAKDGATSFQSMGRSIVGELTAIAGGYFGIQEAIQLVNGHIEQQRELLGETREAHIALAAAQQDTFKNLIASDVLTQSKLIREAVPQLAKETGFSDLPKLTLAIGAGKSAGGTDDQILSAIRASAPLNRLSPEGLDATVQGALLLAQTTGIDDARKNLNLLLSTADPALVKDPNKLAQLVPAAVANTVATTRGQDPVTASREAAALFATINKGGNDFQGESTVTNQATFTAYLNEFFKNRTDDPGTVFGRLGQLKNSDELRAQFLEKLPGEAKFKVVLEQLTETTSLASQRLKENFEQIRIGTEIYNQKLQQSSAGTPQLALATFEQSVKAEAAASAITKSDDATLGSIRKTIAPELAKNRPSGLFASTFNYLTDNSSRMGSNASDAAFEGVRRLLGQIAEIKADGIQPGEQVKIASLQSTLESLFRLVENAAGAFEPEYASQTRSAARRMAAENQMAGADPVYAQSYNRLADLLEKVVKSNEAIAASNQAMVAPTEAAAIELSKTPSVTGALGSAAEAP